jgi:hypothetical protein
MLIHPRSMPLHPQWIEEAPSKIRGATTMTSLLASVERTQTLTNTATPEARAPLMRDAWYVVAVPDEVDRTLKQRWTLGEPVCVFETADGDSAVVETAIRQ